MTVHIAFVFKGTWKVRFDNNFISEGLLKITHLWGPNWKKLSSMKDQNNVLISKLTWLLQCHIVFNGLHYTFS